jgi:CYTH domain-containing protein
VNLKKLIDPKTEILVKERICFLWNGQHFELDIYRGRHEGLAVLGVEPVDDGETSVHIPPFISVERNITNNPRYGERSMAGQKRGSAA